MCVWGGGSEGHEIATAMFTSTSLLTDGNVSRRRQRPSRGGSRVAPRPGVSRGRPSPSNPPSGIVPTGRPVRARRVLGRHGSLVRLAIRGRRNRTPESAATGAPAPRASHAGCRPAETTVGLGRVRVGLTRPDRVWTERARRVRQCVPPASMAARRLRRKETHGWVRSGACIAAARRR